MADGIAWDDEAPAPTGIAWDDAPNVGPWETWVNKTLAAVPGARPAADALAAGTLQGFKLFGLGGERAQLTPQARATLEAHGTPVPTPQEAIPGPVVTYRQVRDTRKARTEAGAQQNPTAANLGTATGVGLTLLAPLPKANLGASLAGRLGSGAVTGAGYGALAGLTEGDADLTRGEWKRAALETALGGGIGAAGGAAASGVASGVGAMVKALRGRAGKGVQAAVNQEAARQTELAEKSIRSKQGEFRSAVQSASRDLEVMQREAQSLPPGPLRDSIERYLNSPEGLAVRQQVAANKLGTAPERVSEMTTKADELAALTANKAANVEAQTAEALSQPWKKHFKPRLFTLGHRMLPPALAAAGGVVGGAEGAVAGGAIGATYSLIQGRNGIIVRNLLREPATRKAFWEKVLGATGGENPAASKVVQAIQRAAENSPAALAAALARYGKEEGVGADIVRRMAEVSQAPEGTTADLVLDEQSGQASIDPKSRAKSKELAEKLRPRRLK